jgi:hypothetical protein
MFPQGLKPSWSCRLMSELKLRPLFCVEAPLAHQRKKAPTPSCYVLPSVRTLTRGRPDELSSTESGV